MTVLRPVAQVDLVFSDWRPRHLDDPLQKDLSAVARLGRTLFVSSDETASIERLTLGPDGRGADHVHIPLDSLFDLPDGAEGEMDIEGLCARDGHLWIVGSHALTRSKPKLDKHGRQKALKRMRSVARQANRFFLGRAPLKEEAPGVFLPVAEDGDRRAASVKLTRKTSRLVRWLEDDPHLSPFLSIPAKENGFDVEGVAARGERVFVGLRGPVLRGHAVVLELRLRDDGKGRLKARRRDDGSRIAKHLVDTRGLGIRDMRLSGDDLLLLVGPTMALDGRSLVLRWRGAAADDEPGVVPSEAVEVIAELPYGETHDHPEGLELWPEAGEGALFVLYDAPGEERMDADRHTVRADVFLPGRAPPHASAAE